MIQMSVILTRYSESDEVVGQCLGALAAQRDAELEILFLDQKHSAVAEKLCEVLTSETVHFTYMPIPAKSLSYARNLGLRTAKTDLVAFLDADALADERWAAEIVRVFEVCGADIVGTKIVPYWQSKVCWFHHSKYIQEFYSLLDLGKEVMTVKKIVGASFAVNRAKFKDQFYFDENLGRRGGVLLGGEETDLCQRILALGGKIYYTPKTFVRHMVSRERISLRWLWRRAYFGGLSRAFSGGKIETYSKTAKFLDYLALPLILPSYFLGYAQGILKKK